MICPACKKNEVASNDRCADCLRKAKEARDWYRRLKKQKRKLK